MRRSRLLDIVEGTCHARLITVDAPRRLSSAPSARHPPTLLVDKADAIFGGQNAKANEDLRGLLNAAPANWSTIRSDNAARRLETIPTFAMAASPVSGDADTIEDHAVVIRMRRRAEGESVARSGTAWTGPPSPPWPPTWPAGSAGACPNWKRPSR